MQVQPLQPEPTSTGCAPAFYECSTYEGIRRQVQEHLNHYNDYVRQWGRLTARDRCPTSAALRRRLERMPAEQHEALVAFKHSPSAVRLPRAKVEIT